MNLQNVLSKTWAKVTLLIVMAANAITQMSIKAVSASDTLWGTTSEAGVNNVITKITLFYRRWSLPFTFVSLILYAFTKDEKKREIEKKAVIIMIAMYILTFIWSWITGSINDIGNTLVGGTTP